MSEIARLFEAYRQQVETRLPGWSASLGSPVSPQQLDEAAQRLGRELPEELRQLYSLHDGESQRYALFPGMRWLPLSELLQQWQGWCDLLPDYEFEGDHFSHPPDWIQEKYVEPGWLPLCEDWGGNHFGLDLSPAQAGRPGQLINFGRDEEHKYVVALSLADWLAHLLRLLQEGALIAVDGERLELADGSSLHGALQDWALPVGRAATPTADPDPQSWYQQLPPEWQAVAADPKAFLRTPQLYLMNKGLTHLEPLRACIKAAAIHLANNRVADLAPLGGLPVLKILGLQGNPVTDVSALRGCPRLAQLHLDRSPFEASAQLAELSGLQELRLMATPLRRVEPLQALPDLRSLTLPADLVDLPALSGLQRLQSLGLQDGGRLPALKGVKALRFEQALVQAQDPAALARVEELTLHECRLESADWIARLPRLKSLTLYETELESLEVLAGATALQEVSCSIEQFLLLKDRLPQRPRFPSLSGDLSAEQRAVWRAYSQMGQ